MSVKEFDEKLSNRGKHERRFLRLSPRDGGRRESIFKTSASSFLVQERVVFSLILVIILQDETFSMLELQRLSHFESVLKRGIVKLILSWYRVTQSMLLSNVKADQSSYWGHNTSTGRQIFDQFNNRVAKSS